MARTSKSAGVQSSSREAKISYITRIYANKPFTSPPGDGSFDQTLWGRTNTTALDLTVPANPPYLTSAESTHTYDAAERLVNTSSTMTTEKLSYLTGGGTQSEKTRTITSSTSSITTPFVTVLTLDEQRRWLSVEMDSYSWSGSVDGIPDIIDAYSYAADGTTSVMHLDFLSNTPNDSAEYKGRSGRVYRRDYILSPQCTAVDAAIPRTAGEACRYPMRAWINRMTW